MRTLILAGGALALCTAAQAATIGQTERFDPVIVVDGGSRSADTVITQSGRIADVNLAVDLTGSGETITQDGNPLGGGDAAFEELSLSLTSPLDTEVTLILRRTFSTGDSRRVTLFLDDEASRGLFGDPENGPFQPVGSLSTFDGEDAAGTWTVTIGDSFEGAPKSLNEFELQIETADSTVVPVPATLPLLAGAVGLLGLAARRGRG
jgi:hypothetical protein